MGVAIANEKIDLDWFYTSALTILWKRIYTVLSPIHPF